MSSAWQWERLLSKQFSKSKTLKPIIVRKISSTTICEVQLLSCLLMCDSVGMENVGLQSFHKLQIPILVEEDFLFFRFLNNLFFFWNSFLSACLASWIAFFSLDSFSQSLSSWLGDKIGGFLRGENALFLSFGQALRLVSCDLTESPEDSADWEELP